MMKGTSYYAHDAVIPFATGFTDRSRDVVESCSLTRMNVRFTEMVNVVILVIEAGREWRVR